MYLLIIPLLCLLATAKVLTQSRFAKKNTNGFADSAMFNAMVFATMGLLGLSLSNLSEINASVIFGAACFGFFNVSFQIMYQIALSCGPTSITALIASLASIVPLITSAAIYREPLSVANTVGVVLIIITLVMNADIKKDTDKSQKPASKKWFLLIMLAFFANAFGMLSQQVYAKTTGATSSSTFVACSSIVASLFALATYLVLRIRGHRMSYKITPKKMLPCVAVGLILGVFQIIHTYSMAVIPGTVLFPSYSAGAPICIALCSRLIFREKLSRTQCISFAIGIVAILLINI